MVSKRLVLEPIAHVVGSNGRTFYNRQLEENRRASCVGKILTGKYPNLSIEITRECPLRCPGCHAYEDGHLNGNGNLRQISDFSGDDLVENILVLVDRHKPLHLSIVGGEPLVKFRELNTLLPILSRRGIAVQIVTSAVREIPKEWADIPELYLVVSIDGL